MQSTTARPRSVTFWLLRVLATGWLIQIMAQIILAAEFVSGNVGMFHAHSTNGSLLSFLPLIMLVVAIIHATAARGIRWPILVTAIAWPAAYVQEILGYARALATHIVGGTVLLGIAVALVVLLWRSRYTSRPRRARSSGGGDGMPPVPATATLAHAASTPVGGSASAGGPSGGAETAPSTTAGAA